MKKFLANKKKLYSLLFLISIIIIGLTLFINITTIQNYQAYLRDETRKKDLQNIKLGVEKYINTVNNCPKTSNPVPHTYLPNLILEDGYLKGGVPVFTLEDMNDFYDTKKAFDPKSNPYFIGIKDNYIYIYSVQPESYNFNQKSNESTIKNINVFIDAKLCSNTN